MRSSPASVASAAIAIDRNDVMPRAARTRVTAVAAGEVQHPGAVATSGASDDQPEAR